MGCSPADYKKWYGDLEKECPVTAAINKKEEKPQPVKAAEKEKVGKNVPSYLL